MTGNQALEEFLSLKKEIDVKYDVEDNIKMHLVLEILKINNYKKRTDVIEEELNLIGKAIASDNQLDIPLTNIANAISELNSTVLRSSDDT